MQSPKVLLSQATVNEIETTCFIGDIGLRPAGAVHFVLRPCNAGFFPGGNVRCGQVVIPGRASFTSINSIDIFNLQYKRYRQDGREARPKSTTLGCSLW